MIKCLNIFQKPMFYANIAQKCLKDHIYIYIDVLYKYIYRNLNIYIYIYRARCDGAASVAVMADAVEEIMKGLKGRILKLLLVASFVASIEPQYDTKSQ